MAASVRQFTGFGPRALDFLAELEANNSREWWHANRRWYDDDVREPLELLLADLADEFGEAKVFRPNRDTRFSKDKTPYKTWAAAVVWRDGGSLYVSLSREALFVAGGGYRLARDQLVRFREAIDDDRRGGDLEKILADLRRRRAEIGGEQLKTAPRGWSVDHPRISLLRRDGITAGWNHRPGPWLHTKKVRDKVAQGWRAVTPLNTWLAKHVGPSTLPAR